MADRVCTTCWAWFPPAVSVCPNCGASLTAQESALPSSPIPAGHSAARAADPRRRAKARHRRGWLLWGLVLSIVAVVSLGIFPAPQLGLWGNPGCTFPGSTCTRVLFIGNSYTSVNDLPATFADLAWSGGHRVETAALDDGGWTLAQHVSDPATATALGSEPWNTVVLQEQSQIPATAVSRTTEMFPAATTLVGMIRDHHESPMFYLTFAHRDGYPQVGLPDYASMQEAIDEGYLEIAEQLGVPVAPVGDAWRTVAGEPSAPTLWQADGSHPTAGGTYLAACVFYAAIFAESPVGLGDADGLAAGEAHTLQSVAASTVFGDPSKWGLAS